MTIKTQSLRDRFVELCCFPNRVIRSHMCLDHDVLRSCMSSDHICAQSTYETMPSSRGVMYSDAGAAGTSLPWPYVVSNMLPPQGSKALFPPCSSKQSCRCH